MSLDLHQRRLTLDGWTKGQTQKAVFLDKAWIVRRFVSMSLHCRRHTRKGFYMLCSKTDPHLLHCSVHGVKVWSIRADGCHAVGGVGVCAADYELHTHGADCESNMIVSERQPKPPCETQTEPTWTGAEVGGEVKKKKENDQESKECENSRKAIIKTPSLKTLIVWNISKALKSEPRIDLKKALRKSQERLESARDVEALLGPDAHNLSCALLAWQQLGHRDADSLFNFVQQTLKEESERKQHVETLHESVSCEKENPDWPTMRSQNSEQKDSSRTACQWGAPAKMDFSTSIGLVVKLPYEPQTLMHLSGPVRVPQKANKCCSGGNTTQCGTINKIDSACCLDAACMEQLLGIESQTKELRRRAAHFAKRESQRAELLERAEMAWRDLDSGYQRRLRIAKDKEDEYEKQIKRMLDERNRYKAACMPVVEVLKTNSELAEQEQESLKQLEQVVCVKACARLQLAEQDAVVDAQLTAHQCKAGQLDRNLALKEEQERRKQRSLAGEAEAAQLLTHEAEYAQRNELGALRAQVQQASQELLQEDARTTLLKKRIEEYIEEKNEMIEDLEACQTKCDGRMSGLTNDLKSKREKIAELKAKIMECLCKEPVDRAVEVRRTPSLAAMCRCSPSEMLHGTCSCTSVRSRLLSSLLKDLFGGLKSEMESIGSQMPCHLLKCLEDKHNWDRSNDIKTNVRAYFSQLLLGELDIAIATVIEKCHAQWVGECCADLRKPQMNDSRHSLRWQEHELEMKTQKMATKLAEKMFLDKAKELAKLAQDNLTKEGRPPCECDMNDSCSTGKYASAVYRCQVQTHPTKLKTVPTNASDNVYRKDKPLIQPTPVGFLKKAANGTTSSLHPMDKNKKREWNNQRPETTMKINGNAGKPAATRKISNFTARKPNKSVLPKGDLHKVGINAPNKVFKGPQQQYSVNMCLCDNKNHLTSSKSHESCQLELESSYDQTFSSPLASLRQSKPILLIFPDKNSKQNSDVTTSPLCTEKVACFHKTPSNTSVDRLISILTNWKDNLIETQDRNIKKALSTDSLFKITHLSIMNVLHQLDSKPQSKHSMANIKKVIISDKNIKSFQESQKAADGEDSRTIISNQNYCYAQEGAQNTSPFKCMRSFKHLRNKSVSAEADIQLDPIKSYIAIESITKLNKVVNPDALINKNNNTAINCVEEFPAINHSLSCVSRPQEGEKCIQCLGVTLANVNKYAKQENQRNEASHFQQQIKNHFHKSNNEQKCRNENNIDEVGDIAKFPSINPNICSENYIQFLGVTLNNAKEIRMSKQNVTTKKCDVKPDQDEVFDDKQRNNKPEEKRLNINVNRDFRKTKCAFKQIKGVNILHVRNGFENTRHKDNQLGENKSAEVQNDRNNILNPKPCICCPTLNADSSNDLEVNTFQLLEEHLKGQLEEFRNFACKSSCMQNMDNSSIFGDTLKKVKKLILENACSVTCKCVKNCQSNGGSWNRAYSLLQEYLKTKIEHVKCLCNSPENSKEENLVPHVLSKISCLIENDLQRLKDICKCSHTKSAVLSKLELNHRHEPQCIGEVKQCNTATMSSTTDNNYLSKSQMVETMIVKYTNPPSLPYDKSAQVLLRQSVLTKSCDALRTYTEFSEVQTDDIMNTKLIIEGNNTESEYDCRSLSKEDKDEITQEGEKSNLPPELQGDGISTDLTRFQKGDLTVLPIVISSGNRIVENDLKQNTLTGHESSVDDGKIHDLGNLNKTFDKPFSPYVGCTINCSCDSDLGCVCTKSTIPTNNNLDDIWKTFTRKSHVIENVSYILNKIPCKLPEDVNSLDITKDFRATDEFQINNLIQCDSESGTIDANKMFPNRHEKREDVDNDNYKTEIVQVSQPNMCETEVSAREEKHIYLKQSNQSLDMVTSTSATNTLTHDYSLQSISMLHKSLQQGILKRNKYEFKKYAPIHSGSSESTLMSDLSSRRTVSCSTNCDCTMVPICHVKMLMENIGNKLVKAECTCDSLKSVCPIHS